MVKILLISILLFLHPLHVTLTTINQDQGSDTLRLFFRMYFDDFQRDYKLYYPDFKTVSGSDTANFPPEKFTRYFNDRVRLFINHKMLSGKLSDLTINTYEIRVNFVYQSDKKPREFRIINQVLTRIYNDQANMVYLNINRYENALKLTVDQFEESIKIK